MAVSCYGHTCCLYLLHNPAATVGKKKALTDMFVVNVNQLRNKPCFIRQFALRMQALFTCLHHWRIKVELPNRSSCNQQQRQQHGLRFHSDLEPALYATAKAVMMQCCDHATGPGGIFKQNKTHFTKWMWYVLEGRCINSPALVFVEALPCRATSSWLI